MVVSGFLGAGKTTTMLALTRYINGHGKKAAIIANDLGASNIIDAEYSSRYDVEVTPLAGTCICYAGEALIERIERLNKVPKDIVMSDIPGWASVPWSWSTAGWTGITRMTIPWPPSPWSPTRSGCA